MASIFGDRKLEASSLVIRRIHLGPKLVKRGTFFELVLDIFNIFIVAYKFCCFAVTQLTFSRSVFCFSRGMFAEDASLVYRMGEHFL